MPDPTDPNIAPAETPTLPLAEPEERAAAQVPQPRPVFVAVEAVAGADVVATRLARALRGERINGPLEAAGPGATEDPERLAEHLVDMAASIASGLRVHPVVVSGYLVSAMATAAARADITRDDVLGLFEPHLARIHVPDLIVHLHASPDQTAQLLAANPKSTVEVELLADPALLARRLARQGELAALDTTASHLPISNIDPDQAVEAILHTLVHDTTDPHPPATT